MQSQTKQVLSREHSSVGLEHLPYKQRVGGSTPSAPTKSLSDFLEGFFLCILPSSARKEPVSWAKRYPGGLFCNIPEDGGGEGDEVGWRYFDLHSTHAGADVDGREVKRCGVDEGWKALFRADR